MPFQRSPYTDWRLVRIGFFDEIVGSVSGFTRFPRLATPYLPGSGQSSPGSIRFTPDSPTVQCLSVHSNVILAFHVFVWLEQTLSFRWGFRQIHLVLSCYCSFFSGCFRRGEAPHSNDGLWGCRCVGYIATSGTVAGDLDTYTFSMAVELHLTGIYISWWCSVFPRVVDAHASCLVDASPAFRDSSKWKSSLVLALGFGAWKACNTVGDIYGL